MVKMEVRLTMVDGKGMMDDVVSRLKKLVENEMRSCSMDLTMSKPLTLDNIKASFSLYSLNRGLRMHNAALRL